MSNFRDALVKFQSQVDLTRSPKCHRSAFKPSWNNSTAMWTTSISPYQTVSRNHTDWIINDQVVQHLQPAGLPSKQVDRANLRWEFDWKRQFRINEKGDSDTDAWGKTPYKVAWTNCQLQILWRLQKKNIKTYMILTKLWQQIHSYCWLMGLKSHSQPPFGCIPKPCK